MNLFFKLIWILCLMTVFMSVSAVVLRFYQTGRLLMFFAGFVALLFLASMLANAVFVLFVKGA